VLPGQILRVFKRKAGAARVSVGDLGGAQTTAIDSTCGYLPTDKFEYFRARRHVYVKKPREKCVPRRLTLVIVTATVFSTSSAHLTALRWVANFLLARE
jgi:hypothetical protein